MSSNTILNDKRTYKSYYYVHNVQRIIKAIILLHLMHDMCLLAIVHVKQILFVRRFILYIPSSTHLTFTSHTINLLIS